MTLKDQAEEFLYAEADLLDQRRFAEWLDLLADDLVYFMPLRRNVKHGQHAAHENTREGEDISWFEEDKWTLAKRVEQIQTGVHWAEEPLSRVCHMVSNVRILETRSDQEIVVGSRFLVYQNRLEDQVALFAGSRRDVLRRVDGQWLVARREIRLAQSTLLAKALALFF